jgi:hypothetical protein
MHRFRKLLREGSWVVLGSTLLVSGMVFLIRDSINWGVVLNGTGDAIPTTAPQESNRISIASCSIVLPDRWNGTTHVVDETGYANMVAWPDSVLPKKHGAGLRVEVSPARPQGFNAATERKFLGYIAHETVSYRDGGVEHYQIFVGWDHHPVDEFAVVATIGRKPGGRFYPRSRNAYAGWGITLYLLGLILASQVAAVTSVYASSP